MGAGGGSDIFQESLIYLPEGRNVNIADQYAWCGVSAFLEYAQKQPADGYTILQLTSEL